MMTRALDNPKLVEKLGLDSEQVKSLRELGYEAKKRDIDLRAAAAQARLEIRRLLSQDEPNEEAVMSAIDQAGAATTALQKSHIKHMLEGRAVVGNETWRKMHQTLRHKDQKGMRSMRHQGGRRPGSGPDRRDHESSRPPRHQPSFNPGRVGPDNGAEPVLDIDEDLQATLRNEPMLNWPDDAPVDMDLASPLSADDTF